jgi:hypothetical protein
MFNISFFKGISFEPLQVPAPIPPWVKDWGGFFAHIAAIPKEKDELLKEMNQHEYSQGMRLIREEIEKKYHNVSFCSPHELTETLATLNPHLREEIKTYFTALQVLNHQENNPHFFEAVWCIKDSSIPAPYTNTTGDQNVDESAVQAEEQSAVQNVAQDVVQDANQSAVQNVAQDVVQDANQAVDQSATQSAVQNVVQDVVQDAGDVVMSSSSGAVMSSSSSANPATVVDDDDAVVVDSTVAAAAAVAAVEVTASAAPVAVEDDGSTTEDDLTNDTNIDSDPESDTDIDPTYYRPRKAAINSRALTQQLARDESVKKGQSGGQSRAKRVKRNNAIQE